MYSLFSSPQRSYQGTISDYPLNNAFRRLREDTERVVSYHHHGTFFTDSDHLLVKLINTIAPPLSYEDYRYVEASDSRSLFVSNTLQLTSSINYGKWHTGVFYPGCLELIIAYQEEHDLEAATLNWQTLCPVQLLESPVSNLKLLVPNGKRNNLETGLVVVGIDLTLLMIQYRAFCLNERVKLENDRDDLLNTKHFVGKYVLPNMLYRQTDLAIFNRLSNLISGAPMGEGLQKHPFYITDYQSQIDKQLTIFQERLENSDRTFENYLEQIPWCFGKQSLAMPDMAETRQVWWSLFLARKREMQWLLETGSEKGQRRNSYQIGQLKIAIKEFRSDKIYNKVLPSKYLDEMNAFFRYVDTLK